MRDSYVKYLKFLRGATGSAKKFKNWPWAANLEFLRDKVSMRPTETNVPKSNETEDVPVDSDEDAADDPQMPPPSKKIKQKEVSTDVDTILKYLDSKKETKQKKELDRTDYLFLSYAETFKKFSPRTQTIIKMEMAQMFGRAELRDMDGETPPPSSPFSSSSSWHSTPNYPGNSSEGVNYTEHQNYTSGPTLGSRAHSTESVKGFYENFTGET